jgi:N-acetylneuraminate synthase
MLTIGGVSVGGDTPCRFVAEMSNNHNGHFARALRLIDAAQVAGADFVKFQCYTPAELVALRGDGPAPDPWGQDGWSMKTLYEKARTPLAWFPDLFAYARGRGLVPFSSVFGAESMAVLESIDCPAYKIARLDNAQDVWMDAFGTGKPLIMSCGPNDVLNHNAALRLWCPEGYPAPVDALRLPFFCPDDNPFFVRHGDYHGLSSHCLDPRVPIAAVARGCKMIEMHFMLDDEPSELEANVSLTASQFQRMIADVRATEAMIG